MKTYFSAMPGLTKPQIRFLLSLLSEVDQNGMVPNSTWGLAGYIPQKAALVGSGVVRITAPIIGPVMIDLRAAIVRRSFPNAVGFAWSENHGWRVLRDITDEDPVYFGVVDDNGERVAVERASVLAHVRW